jgi:hypothetical protein
VSCQPDYHSGARRCTPSVGCTIGVIAWVAAAVSVPFFLYVAVYMAPAEQRIAQQQERDAIERENIAFCEKHGMLVGTREYPLCAEDLTDIRTKQSQRTVEEIERTF